MTITRRSLIVNADDFGQSRGINRGVAQTFESGIVTSCSLMVRQPAAAEAAGYAREHPELSVGLHLDLGEWAWRDGAWRPVYTVMDSQDAVTLKEEIDRQLDTFHTLLGRNPTHMDSHQHVHRDEPLRSILADKAGTLGVPVRHCSVVKYCGSFYGQTATGEPWRESITVDALLRILAELPSGVTELGCHPGMGIDLDSMYLHEREQETAVLCDPRIRQAIASEDIVLCSFHDIA
jgi:predicted glycoside hydrolase/deacetylase ChbG (UPF0249 family)